MKNRRTNKPGEIIKSVKTLEVRNFGPIKRGRVEFGDLTVFVGTQASGKSLLLQLYKAIIDAPAIRRNLRKNGFKWSRSENPEAVYLAIYFGGGMESIWNDATKIYYNRFLITFREQVAIPPRRSSADESVFLIPAQRVLVFQDGWPRPFGSYSKGDPYCLRNFSEELRKLMDSGLGGGEAIFPQPRRLKSEIRRLVDEGIYVSGKLKLDTIGARQRIVLYPSETSGPLPFTAWSAGQREFTPLLLGLYWLIPPAAISKRENIQTVIVEEPEMGLHPKAILTFCFIVLELLDRGYKVIISTHSPIILDVVWMLKEMKSFDENKSMQAMKEVFDIQRLDVGIRKVLLNAVKLDCRTYYFDREGETVTIRDISSLDPGADDRKVSGWGGLSGYSGRIADVIGRLYVESGS